MLDPNTVGIILIAVAIGALILRLAALRSPRLRPWANVAMIIIAALLLSLVGIFASAMVAGYVGGLPD